MRLRPTPLIVGEKAANENAIVRFNGKRLNPTVGHGIKSGIERPIAKDTGDKGSIDTGVLSKAPAENNLPVMLQGERENISTGANSGIKRGIKHAIRQHPRDSATSEPIVADKCAANNNRAIRLNDDCVDVAARSVEGIKTQVNAAVSVEPGEIESLGQIDLGKLPADNDAAIPLQREGERRRVVDPVTESECLIDTAISVQPANAIVGEPIEAGETARHHNASIRLKNGGSNFPIRARARIEGGVERAVKVEARDPIASDVICLSKTAGDNYFPVGLRDDGIDGVVCSRRGDERGIDAAGRGSRRWGRDNGAAETEEEKEKKARKRRAMHLLKPNISS